MASKNVLRERERERERREQVGWQWREYDGLKSGVRVMERHKPGNCKVRGRGIWVGRLEDEKPNGLLVSAK